MTWAPAMSERTDADPRETAIRVTDLRRTYGRGAQQVEALRGVSFDVLRGEVLALVGPSGSGKTTLLNCLLGLDRPDEGRAEVAGIDVTSLSYEEAVAWRRRNAAVAFQNPGLLGHLSAVENVDVALRIRNVARSDRAERIDEAFDQLGIAEFASHLPSELSGGQRQRVALARALAARPTFLVADEPTGELDSDTTQTVLRVMRSVAGAAGITMILATHDPAVEAEADRTLRLVDGAVT